jgi:hypothetical protein
MPAASKGAAALAGARRGDEPWREGEGKGVQEDVQLTRSATEGSGKAEEVAGDDMDDGQHRAGTSRFGRLGASRQAGVVGEVSGEEAKLHRYSRELGAARNDGAARRPELGFRELSRKNESEREEGERRVGLGFSGGGKGFL